MEITVECNKLFIQDLPAGGSFSLFFIFFFQANQAAIIERISPV